jgi:hypothetical protein
MLKLLARQQDFEEVLFLRRRRRRLVDQRRVAARPASLAIALFGHETLLAQIGSQPGMRLDIELEATLFHSHRRGDGPDLNLVCGLLEVETGQDLLGQSPRQHGVDRRIVDLFPRQSRGVPVGSLQRLVEFDPEMMDGGVVEAGGVLAKGQPGRLQGAVDLAYGDAGVLQKGKLEGGVVSDDVDAFEQIEDAARMVQIDDEGLVAAVVDLQQPDAGAVRVEPGRLGVFDFDRETPACALSLRAAFNCPAISALARMSPARRSSSVLFGAVSMSIATQSAASISPRRRRACASSAQ